MTARVRAIPLSTQSDIIVLRLLRELIAAIELTEGQTSSSPAWEGYTYLLRQSVGLREGIPVYVPEIVKWYVDRWHLGTLSVQDLGVMEIAQQIMTGRRETPRR